MGVKVASSCLHWSQPIIPHSPSSSQTLASAISSPSSKRRSRSDAGTLVCRYSGRFDRSVLFGQRLIQTKLCRSRSCEYPQSSRQHTVRRTCSASLDAFDESESYNDDNAVNSESESRDYSNGLNNSESDNYVDPPWEDEIIQASIERKANSVELPLSLRIIKRKLQWEDGFREAGESAYCSVKKAFSSMVFIIRELHSFTLQMREILFYEDLQGILVRVQKEMHASFVWLFQQVFSHTPTLMVYVMILLANFTVHSMASNTAIAAAPPPGYQSATTETASVTEIQDQNSQKFDTSSIKTFSVSSSSCGKTTSIGGNNGGGGKIRPVASGTDGDGGFDRMDHFRTIVPDGASQLSSFGTTREAESVSGQVITEEELSLWNSIVDEASKMQDSMRDDALDVETMQKFVSPVTANIESDDYADYFKTELLYQTGLAREPNNPLLLANYAQFLYLVPQDYDRAEEYFKKAIAAEPPDAEAFSKYASFLWKVRNDLWAAEETFLEAIAVDPTNSYYAANYAHFLWNTGGEDTCFPLSSPDATQDQEA
ncbi:Tetratricopeptide repeat (TPR)-like superfamily protein [Melia azedarach]|uniref:Tetratricopeptide repeat (TPR)-like superfamily protein n=1 Tax=Melia azedarach TaxID=155640 RepID=A0ACC1YR34_MELAZ|nr:Tetratricopeptide repeat (TPR)-like superfamily protein [Melia azedarach]